MLEYKLIESKPNITLTINGEKVTIKDLLASNYANHINWVNGSSIIVNKYYVARPDLISLALYKTDKYADILCKVNGISNPFELNEDMILFCPSPDILYEFIDNNISSSEIIKTDNETKTMDLKVNASDRRLPGDPVVGEKNYVIDKSLGIVIY